MDAMNHGRPLAALALALLVTAGLAGCGKSEPASTIPPIPASSDPNGNDLVEGAIVAAEEKAGGLRLYKILHVDDYPDPIGYEYHLTAYDPKATTFEEAARIWSTRQTKVAMAHMEVRQVHFLPRNHRVLAVEPLTPEERAVYSKARDSRK